MFINIMVGFVAVLIVGIIVLTILMVAKPDIFLKNRKKNGDVISADDLSLNSPEQNTIFGQEIGDTKRFNPVRCFEDNAMDMGNHNYRAVIEVSSVNYGLMSEMEQDMIENGYHNFLNSLDFPVEIYIQTREFDMDLMMDNLHSNISKSTKRFKNIEKYAKEYENQMANVTQYIRNSKIKKKYIIVPFNNTDLSDVSELTNYEIKQFALEELMNRCYIVTSGIGSIGLNAKILDKSETAEVLYSYFHRDSYRIANDIVKGSFDTLVVEKTNEKKPTKRTRLDSILLDCQNRIKKELISADSTDKEIDFYNYIYSVMEFFKQDDRSSFMGDLVAASYDTALKNGNGREYTEFVKNNPDMMEETNFEKDNPDISPYYFSPGFFDGTGKLEEESTEVPPNTENLQNTGNTQDTGNLKNVGYSMARYDLSNPENGQTQVLRGEDK